MLPSHDRKGVFEPCAAILENPPALIHIGLLRHPIHPYSPNNPNR